MGPNLPPSHENYFFFRLWGRVGLNVALETYSMTSLGQNLAILFWMGFSPCYLFLLKSYGIKFLAGKNKPDET